MPLQQVGTCCLTDYTYYQTKNSLHFAILVYFYVLDLVTKGSSHWVVSYTECFLKFCKNSLEKTCAKVSTSIEFLVALKMRFQHRCFAMNIAKFLRTAFFIEHL